jgi:signal transduction histidine kinase
MMLDSSTMLFVVSAMFVLLPLVVWLSLYRHHNEVVKFWCAGSLLAALGLLLMAGRAHIPTLITHHLANASLAFVFVLWAHGMRTLRRAALPLWLLPLIFVLMLAFYSGLYAWAEPNSRGVAMRLLLTVLAAWVALEALHCARQLKTANAYPIAAAMALMSIVLLAQVIMSGGGGHLPSPFSKTWDASLVAAVALLMAMVTHFSFVGMIIELALRQELKQRSEAMALQHASMLDSQLMNLERQRRMVLVSGALAHELNQPLTVALTNAQLMHRLVDSGKMVSDTLAELLNKMSLGIERAASILQRIREMEPHADNVLKLEVVDLYELSKQALEHLKHDVQSNALNVRILQPEQPLWCNVDALSTSQVLVNLIRNAIQSMQGQDEKSLLMMCQGTPERVWVEISDTGPGLSDQMASDWGQAFFTTRDEGLGLGLAISRTLTQQMGGTLELRNRSQSGGAVATLTFPRAPEPPQNDATDLKEGLDLLGNPHTNQGEKA